MAGDFNLNLFNSENSSQSQEFLDLIYSSSCIPLISKPTRVTDTSATLIDNISSNILPPPKSGILVTDISDHFPIFISFPLATSRSNSHSTQENLTNLKQVLIAYDWSSLFNSYDVNTAFIKIMDIFNTNLEKCIPLKYNKSRSRKLTPKSTWITLSLCRSIHR